MNAVIVHDGTVHPGGAVKVVIEAARALDADVIIGFSGVGSDWWTGRCPNSVRILSKPRRFLNDLRNARQFHRLKLPEYDLVMTSGPAAKFYRPTDGQRRIHYLHHPPLAQLWGDGGFFNYAQSVVDRIETLTLPTVIANSELTAVRYRATYGRNVDAIINPPVHVDAFSLPNERTPGRFVMVGRIEERKRPELAVRAFTEIAEETDGEIPSLDVVGDGPLRAELERESGRRVAFHGYVDDDRLVNLIEGAHAGIFLSRREDFGITPVEYLAAGLPVLAVDEPNTNNQISDGITGVLVEPEVAAVKQGIASLLSRDWDRKAIAQSARKYRPERFRKELFAVIDGE